MKSEDESGSMWRDAIRMRGGETHTFSLDGFRAGDYVRAGIREVQPAEGGCQPVTIRLAGGASEPYVSDASGLWQDIRIGIQSAEESAAIALTSETDFWLSHLELVPLSKQKPPVILILVDTLRQDHLHCYGYHRETSPNIDAFREDSVLFTGLVPSSSWTRPSVASLLTSTYPAVHGAQDRGDRVRDDVPWLATAMAGQGYETHAILTNPNCVSLWNFGTDFDRAFEADAKRMLRPDADIDATRLGRRWMREMGHRPYFLYLHAMAPHSPYAPPSPFDTMFDDGETIRDLALKLYDGEIAFFDSLFGEVIQTLKDLGVYQSSLIVLLSDHGEEFWEHGGTTHGGTLFEELLRVPLIIKYPENLHAGKQWDGIVEMVDVAPTLLDILGLPAEPRFLGTSIEPYIDSDERPKTAAYADLQLDSRSIRATKTLTAKLISNAVAGKEFYYDLTADPNELTPLKAPPQEAPLIRRYMEQTAMLGNSGLHILITHDSSTEASIEGTLRAASISDASLHYPESMASSRQVDDTTFEFSATFPAARDPNVPSLRWQEALEKKPGLKGFAARTRVSEQNYAELIAAVPIDGTIQLELRMNGAVFPEAQTHVGAMDTRAALDGGAIEIADMIASPFAFDPAALPVRTAAYVWYLPEPETIAEEALEPELRESLEALGYITD